ncbi:MAG: hypothetical protein P4L51_20650 [Puia sp.]|nr:hypothetical protein [Puia sp.]
MTTSSTAYTAASENSSSTTLRQIRRLFSGYFDGCFPAYFNGYFDGYFFDASL